VATARNPRGARASGASGCATAPLLIWLLVVGLSGDLALKIAFLGIALFVGGWGAFRLYHPSKRELQRRSELSAAPEGATLLQRMQFANAEIQAAVLRSYDEKVIAPIRAQAMNRPYRVARDFSGRLTVTSPASLPGDGRSFSQALLRLKSESWAFSPGMAQLMVHRGSEQLEATSYAVDRVEIGHDIWTNGHGATDHLCITGPDYSPKTVVSLEYYWDFEIQSPLGSGVGGAVSPFLAGTAAESGLPRGVGDAYGSADIERVAPTIVALSRLITDTTGRPINILIGSCRRPDRGD
jgi:hypothetical protein